MPLKLKETNISNEHNRLKNPNWREADQLAIYKHDRGVELETRNNSSLVVRAGLEPVTSGFQVRRPNHSATMSPFKCLAKVVRVKLLTNHLKGFLRPSQQQWFNSRHSGKSNYEWFSYTALSMHLQRMTWRYGWSSQLCTQLKQLQNYTLRTQRVASQLRVVSIVQLVEPWNSPVINSAAVNFCARSSRRASTKHSLAICAYVKMWERKDRAKSPSLSLKRRKQSTVREFVRSKG